MTQGGAAFFRGDRSRHWDDSRAKAEVSHFIETLL